MTVVQRVQTAFSMLTHHALNELYTDSDGCCPVCCAPCGALKALDDEGVLDYVVQQWQTYSDGTLVFRLVEGENGPEQTPSWWLDGQVNREWLHSQWSIGPSMQECH